MDIFLKYFSVIFAIVFVFALLFLTTKLLNYKSKKMLKGNHMQIIESLSLGVNNRIHLIKVDDEFFLISASNKNVEFLARVNMSDFEEEEIKNPVSEVIDFKAILKKSLNGFSFKNQAKKQTGAETNNSSELKPKDPNINNNLAFKRNLEQLKNLNKTISDQRSEDE